MQALLKKEFTERCFFTNVIVGVYCDPFYITTEIKFTYDINMQFLKNLKQLRNRQPTHITGVDSKVNMQQISANSDNCCELFKFLLDDKRCANYQTGSDVHIKYNKKGEIVKEISLIRIILNFTESASIENIARLKNTNQHCKDYNFFQLPFSEVKNKFSEIVRNILPIVDHVEINVVGHGFYDSDRQENFIYGFENERIYSNELLDLFNLINPDFINKIQKQLIQYVCDFNVSVNPFSYMANNVRQISHVFGTCYVTEPFMRNVDMRILYFLANENRFFEEMNIRYRRVQQVDCNAVCLEFNHKECVNKIGTRYVKDRHVLIKQSTAYIHKSLSNVFDILHTVLENWNYEQVFILEIAITGIMHKGKFILWYEDDVFELNKFMRQLIAQNPQLEFAQKIINIQVILYQNQYEQIEFGVTARNEKVNFANKSNSLSDITAISDMLIIWPTCRGYANYVSLASGSTLSFNIALLLKTSHSREMNFTDALTKFTVTPKNYKLPFEYTEINLRKKIIFGQPELSDTPEFYNLNSDTNGYCIIINNKTFPKQLRQKFMTDKTVENYKDAFKRQNFECKIFDDKTAAEMWQLLIDVASDEALESHNALVIVIISSSEAVDNDDIIYGTDGECITTNALKMLFSDDVCDTLKGKLKLFIIDAPRGEFISDYRSKDEIESCENLSNIFDTRLSLMKNVAESLVYCLITPFGQFVTGSYFPIEGFSFDSFYIKVITESGVKSFKIIHSHSNKPKDTCVAVLDELSEYDNLLQYWESTRKKNVTQSHEYKFHFLFHSNCRFPKLEKFEFAQCFCHI
ncbi:caspase-7-like protein [Leptotrombidium deliense]|uniref:Caspase-7-like protein n=1 Tax=Leptotrombidium deliense TaxID=299467 RepID=A0A443SG57_9ACAR|nr:caspase-7-like protein [Leptotrombidium deliense]